MRHPSDEDDNLRGTSSYSRCSEKIFNLGLTQRGGVIETEAVLTFGIYWPSDQ